MKARSMFGWFNAKEAKQFGTSLAAFYIAQVPLGQPGGEKMFASKTQTAMRGMDAKIDAYKAATPLNGYLKARLGNTFKWALRDAGYDVAYVDKLTDWLITRL